MQSYQNIRKENLEGEFQLTEDTFDINRNGEKIFSVVGFRATNFKADAVDKKGTYYICEGECIIYLFKEHAQEFVRSGKLPTAHEKFYRLNTSYGYGAAFPTTGGLWIPNKGVEKQAKMFLIPVMSLIGDSKTNTIQDSPVAELFKPGARSVLNGSVIWGPVITNSTLLSLVENSAAGKSNRDH